MTVSRRPLLISVGCLLVLIAGTWFLFFRDTRAQLDPTGSVVSGTPTGFVLIVPGHGGNKESVEPLATTLSRYGWKTLIIDIGTGTGDITVNSQKVADEAKRLHGEGQTVSLVGYSEGGLIVRQAIQLGAAPYVSRVATIASPHEGTKIAELGVLLKSPECQEACAQMAPGSDFLSSLPIAGDETRWLSVYSTSDEVIRPYESSVLSGATSFPVQDACPAAKLDHGGVVRSPTVASTVSIFLSTGKISLTCQE